MKFEDVPFGEFPHCVKCGKLIEDQEPIYKLTRGKFRKNLFVLGVVEYMPDWPDYDQFHAGVVMCEDCAGLKGEWR